MHDVSHTSKAPRKTECTFWPTSTNVQTKPSSTLHLLTDKVPAEQTLACASKTAAPSGAKTMTTAIVFAEIQPAITGSTSAEGDTGTGDDTTGSEAATCFAPALGLNVTLTPTACSGTHTAATCRGNETSVATFGFR